MSIRRSLLATAAAGTIGIGAYAALPATGGSPPAVQLLSTATAGTAPPAPAAAAPTTPPTTPPCETEEWPDAATGRPAGLAPGGPLGFYLWHGTDGWHLEVTHPTHDHVTFTGWITTNGTLAAQRVDDEHNDHVTVGPHDHVLSFRFNNYGYVDGVHFETRCADRLEIHVSIDGRPATVEQVNVGHRSTHPLSVPFTIDRSGLH